MILTNLILRQNVTVYVSRNMFLCKTPVSYYGSGGGGGKNWGTVIDYWDSVYGVMKNGTVVNRDM